MRSKVWRRLAAAHAKSRDPDDGNDEEKEWEEEGTHAPAVKTAGGQCARVGFGVGGPEGVVCERGYFSSARK